MEIWRLDNRARSFKQLNECVEDEAEQVATITVDPNGAAAAKVRQHWKSSARPRISVNMRVLVVLFLVTAAICVSVYRVTDMAIIPSPQPSSPPPYSPPPISPPPPPDPPMVPPPFIPPSKPPFSPPAEQMLIFELNRRFANGTASDSLLDAGVTMRVWDECTDSARPWTQNQQPPCWDRLSATLVNAQHPEIYSGTMPGGAWHVLSPGFVFDGSTRLQRRISCSYPCDAGTSRNFLQCGQRGGDAGCMPGCNTGSCLDAGAFTDHCPPWCAYPGGSLAAMMYQQDALVGIGSAYNEIIFDTYHQPWEDDLLPAVILAVFVQQGCSEAELARALQVREAFISEYGLSWTDGPPVVWYDHTHPTSPFSLARMAPAPLPSSLLSPLPLPPAPPVLPVALRPLPPPPVPLPPLSPSPLPPPSRAPTLPIVEMLNARFANGGPSDDIAAAGVLVHTLDTSADGGGSMPWQNCDSSRWCYEYSDRWPTSLLWPGHVNMWTEGQGGFVIDPTVVRLMCAYPTDGHSLAITCHPPGWSETCTPGCARACNPGDPDWARCSFPASRLREMMMRQQEWYGPHPWQPATDSDGVQRSQTRYTELVIDAESWSAALPTTIQAVFLLRSGTPEQRAQARDIHAAYVQAYELDEHLVPLLVYDPSRSATAPFTLATNIDVEGAPSPPWQPLPEMMNLEVECWLGGCGESQGACADFCGSRGACCRSGWADSPQECGYGSLGCADYHCCVAAAPET